MRLSRPRPQTQVVLLLPDPVWAGWPLPPAEPGSPFDVVSDSLVDDRGCLTNGPEGKAFPCDINLECRGPLNSTLDQRLGERVLYILLQSPAQRTSTVIAVRTRFL